MEPENSSGCLHLLLFAIPTVIIAEEPRLLEAARATYAHWSAEPPFAEPAIELRLETGDASSCDISLDIRVEGSRLTFRGDGTEGTADSISGKARAMVDPRVDYNSGKLAELTDTLLLFLLARRGRTPVHAAAFMVGDVAVVLAAPSGSGKSSLALAAVERGYPILSDDMVFVQREPSFALWAFPGPIHLFPEDAPSGGHPTRIRNGKAKKAVVVRSVTLKAERTMLVLIEPGDKLALSKVSRAAAVDILMRLDSGFDLLKEESRAAIDALASSGAWRLMLEKHPGAAIEFLVDCLPFR